MLVGFVGLCAFVSLVLFVFAETIVSSVAWFLFPGSGLVEATLSIVWIKCPVFLVCFANSLTFIGE